MTTSALISSSATRWKAATNGSANRTVPPGRLHRPSQGPPIRRASSTPRSEQMTTSTVRRGTFWKIARYSASGSGPVTSPAFTGPTSIASPRGRLGVLQAQEAHQVVQRLAVRLLGDGQGPREVQIVEQSPLYLLGRR